MVVRVERLGGRLPRGLARLSVGQAGSWPEEGQAGTYSVWSGYEARGGWRAEREGPWQQGNSGTVREAGGPGQILHFVETSRGLSCRILLTIWIVVAAFQPLCNTFPKMYRE